MVDGISWDQLLEEAGEEAVADSFDPLPEGVYDLEVVEARHTKTKTTPSKDMWAVQYKVIGGNFNNRRVFNNIVLTLDSQKALGFFFRNMGAHGLTREFFNTKPTNESISTALKGRHTRGQVIQKPYNGEMKNEIKGYRAVAGVATPPPAGAVAPPAGATPPPPPPAAAAPPAPAAAPPAPAPAPAPPVAEAPAPPAPAPAPPAPSEHAGAVPPPPPLTNLPF